MFTSRPAAPLSFRRGVVLLPSGGVAAAVRLGLLVMVWSGRRRAGPVDEAEPLPSAAIFFPLLACVRGVATSASCAAAAGLAAEALQLRSSRIIACENFAYSILRI